MTDDSDVVLWIKDELYKLNIALEAHTSSDACMLPPTLTMGNYGRIWKEHCHYFLKHLLKLAPARRNFVPGPLAFDNMESG